MRPLPSLLVVLRLYHFVTLYATIALWPRIEVGAMVRNTYEEQLLSIDKQIAKLRARKQAAVSRHSQDERKARNHSVMVLGGLMLACFPNGWQSVDFEGVADVIRNNRDAIGQHTADMLATPDASKRLREWERSQKNEEIKEDERGVGCESEEISAEVG